MTVAPPPPVVTAPAGFDWAGPFIGANGGYWAESPWTVGAQAGFNVVRDRTLFGAALKLDYAPGFGGAEWIVTGNGRVGRLLSDNILAYVEGGIGYEIGPGLLWNGGGGVAVGVGQNVSIFAEGAVYGVVAGGCCGYRVVGGINFHP